MRITPKWILLVLFIGIVPPVWSAPVGGKLPDSHTITITVRRDKSNGKEVVTGGETAFGGTKDITVGGGGKRSCNYYAAYSDCSACGQDEICAKVKIRGRTDLQCYDCRGKVRLSGDGKLPDFHTITITVTRDKKKPEEVTLAQQVISGKVFSELGGPVPGAMVNAVIGGKQYTGRSGVDGGYQISIPEDIKVPGTLILMADKKGYNTSSTAVDRSTFEHADITLSTVSKNVIQIDKSLHHLGNSDYAGVANSQFQKPKAEGGTYEKSFEIKPEQLSSNNLPADLILTVKGSENTNPVFINDTQIGGLGITSGDGSASKLEISFDVCEIRLGKNIVRIKSHVENDDIDDFEFANIQLVMNQAEETAIDDRQLSKLSSISVTAGDFGTPLSSVEPGGYFWITAKGESRCAGLKDMAKVLVYPQGTDASKGKQVRLTETGPNTSIFHSEKVPVAQIQAKPGQKIIVRSGLRGTSVRITGGLAASKPSGRTSKKSQAKGDSTNKGKGGTTGSAPNKTTAGANSGGGQMVIPVNAGSSRKAAGGPVQAPAAKQLAAKPVQWVVYKLESHPDPHGGLPNLKVIKIAFRRSAKLAQLHVRSYPVSLSRNDQTGEILWSVNWSNGNIEDQQMASTPATMGQLQQKADGMKPGAVAKADLATLIGRQLGPGSRHL